MRFTVLFLKKKYIYYTILIIVLVVLFVILINTKKVSTTFSTIINNKLIKADLTGDGKEDILYINKNNNKYYIEVNTKTSSLYLQPDKKINTVGTYYSYWPMKITLMDINRNKVPEVFVQASDKNTAVQHIFIWDKDKFKDILCSNNNIFGFLDCNNNKTPKVISANITSSGMTQSNYVLVNNELNNFNFQMKDNFLGKDSILAFISYIQGLPGSETYMPKDIFYPGLTGNDLTAIGKLSAENNTYKFQDGIFMDTKWTKDGDVSEVKWILNFKGTSNRESNINNHFTITLVLKPTANPDSTFYFKIKAITLS